MKKVSKIYIIALTLLIVLFSGCEPVRKAGDATISFIRGDLNIEEMEYNIQEVYDASLMAMEDLDIAVIEKQQDPLKSKIAGRDNQDEKIQIWLTRLSTEKTALKIRIGLTGNETRSWAIYDQIRENL